jgi:hypothetical protein
MGEKRKVRAMPDLKKTNPNMFLSKAQYIEKKAQEQSAKEAAKKAYDEAMKKSGVEVKAKVINEPQSAEESAQDEKQRVEAEENAVEEKKPRGRRPKEIK